MKNVVKDERVRIILKTIADVLDDNWLIKTIVTTAPSLITSFILQGLNQRFYLQDGSWNIKGWIGVAIVAIITLGVNGLLSYKTHCDRKDEEDLKEQFDAIDADVELRNHITSYECITEDRKNRHLRDWFTRYPPSDDVKEYIENARDSRERFCSILDALGECLSIVSMIPPMQINISAIICVGEGKEVSEWTWISPSKLEGTANIEELFQNASALKKVIDGLPFYVKHDKSIDDDKPYYRDKLDESFNNKGTIVCIGYDEKIGKTKIRTVINISTYGRVLIEADDKSSDEINQLYEDIFRNTILLQFEGEIKEELLWYGLQRISNDQEKNNSTMQHPRNRELKRASNQVSDSQCSISQKQREKK